MVVMIFLRTGVGEWVKKCRERLRHRWRRIGLPRSTARWPPPMTVGIAGAQHT